MTVGTETLSSSSTAQHGLPTACRDVTELKQNELLKWDAISPPVALHLRRLFVLHFLRGNQ